MGRAILEVWRTLHEKAPVQLSSHLMLFGPTHLSYWIRIYDAAQTSEGIGSYHDPRLLMGMTHESHLDDDQHKESEARDISSARAVVYDTKPHGSGSSKLASSMAIAARVPQSI